MQGMRLIAATVMAMLALSSSVALAEQGESSTQADQPARDAPSAPSPADPSAEVKAERTATSNTFLLPGGQLETRLYGAPVNYRQPDGSWRPIGEDFEELAGGSLSNGPNSFDVTLPERLGEEPVLFSKDGAWVSSELLGAEPQVVQPEEEIASYESPGAGPDFEFVSLAGGVKETIEISSPSQPSTFRFALDASDGLTPTLEEDGSIQFRDSSGRIVATLPAPVISDSAPEPAVSRAAHYELGPEEEGKWELAVVAEREWLEQPGRIWPAHLDPTIVQGPALDCVIGGHKGETGWIDCAAWGRKDLLVGYSPQLEAAKDNWWRTLMELETTAVPANSEISSATFNIRSLETALNTKGVELRKTTKPWTWQASWSRYDGPEHLWTTEGGDYSESLGEVLTAARGNQAGWWQFNVPAAIVEKEINAGEWLMVIMKLLDDKVRECGAKSCTERKVDFDSSAATTEANRPYLSIVYKAPAPIVTTEAATSVSETGATLKGQVNPHGYATTYQFEYGTTTAYGTKVPTTAESVGSGKAKRRGEQSHQWPQRQHDLPLPRLGDQRLWGTTPGLDKTFTTPKLPSVTTEAASGVKEQEATLKGSVNPNGSSTTYQFEYGTTTSYGGKVPASPASAGSGTTAVAVSKAITGLEEGVTYHYRVAATNAAGTVKGSDQTLKTTHPPQTTITSPTPTYTGHEELSIKFESSQSGSTFKCGLDKGETPTETCTSPFTLPDHLDPGWHTVVVAAVNSEGQADQTPAKYVSTRISTHRHRRTPSSPPRKRAGNQATTTRWRQNGLAAASRPLHSR